MAWICLSKPSRVGLACRSSFHIRQSVIFSLSRFHAFSLFRLLVFTLRLGGGLFAQINVTAEGTQFKQGAAAVNCALKSILF